jgi:hypothetical protein
MSSKKRRERDLNPCSLGEDSFFQMSESVTNMLSFKPFYRPDDNNGFVDSIGFKNDF